METALRKIPLLGAALAAAPIIAHAQDAPAPTGPPALPAICTDRPTKTNVPCTVDQGHFQYESDLFNGTFQRVDGVTTDTYLITNPTPELQALTARHRASRPMWAYRRSSDL